MTFSRPFAEARRARMMESFARHRAESHVSLEQYERELRIDLGKSIEGKYRLYLDKCFWIYLRDAELGCRTDTNRLQLLSLLRQLVRTGTAVCPISGVLFVELLKQSDLKTRRATATLIDELSLGISLASDEERIGTELAHLFHSGLKPDSCYPLDWLVWVKVPYTLGTMHPTGAPFDAETELVVQKAFLDEMWASTLVDMLDVAGDAELPAQVDFAALAQRLTQESRQHDHENRSFKQLYESEMIGAVDLYADKAVVILEQMHERAIGRKVVRSDAEWRRARDDIMRFLVNAVRHGKIIRQLPGVHVHAMCHAAIRWDRQRKFKGNDLFDFHHAEAALGYCDLFLTDGPMRVILTENHVGLDKTMECVVISDIPEAVAFLRELKPKKTPAALSPSAPKS